MKTIKKLFKTVLLGFAIGVCSFGLTSCATAEESASCSSFVVNQCVYDAENDKTKIVWTATIINPSIYNLEEGSFKFDLYLDGSFLRTTDYITWDMPVKHGASKTEKCVFYTKGKVTNAKISVWRAKFSNLWNSYAPWFISVIVIVPILSIAYIVIMVLQDLYLDDLIDFFEDHLWVLPIFAVSFVPYVISSLAMGTWSWVSPLIILGGIVAVVLIVLCAHLVQFIVECVDLGDDSARNPKVKKFYDSKKVPFLEIEGYKKRLYIKDLLDDRQTLSFFSKKDLREYCLQNGWYEANDIFSKGKLVILLMDKSSEKSQEPEKGQKKPRKKATKISKITFDDIAGLSEAKKVFREKVVMPFEHPEIYKKFGKKAGGGILLYGLPGTGKTMFAEAAANEIDALFISIKCSDIKSKWYGESEKKVKDIFTKARKATKAIIFFDEFEAIGGKRTDDADNANNDLVPEILAEMQGVGTSSEDSTIVVIAATNKPWAIDSAFLRPGRFDEKIYIPLPDYEARKRLFELQLKKLPLSDDLDFDYLAKISDGFNGADIKEFCEKMKMSAINESLEKGEEQTIGMDDVRKVENTMRSSVSLEDVDKLTDFENRTY